MIPSRPTDSPLGPVDDLLLVAHERCPYSTGAAVLRYLQAHPEVLAGAVRQRPQVAIEARVAGPWLPDGDPDAFSRWSLADSDWLVEIDRLNRATTTTGPYAGELRWFWRLGGEEQWQGPYETRADAMADADDELRGPERDWVLCPQPEPLPPEEVEEEPEEDGRLACPDCSGRGWLGDEACAACGGRGREGFLAGIVRRLIGPKEAT